MLSRMVEDAPPRNIRSRASKLTSREAAAHAMRFSSPARPRFFARMVHDCLLVLFGLLIPSLPCQARTPETAIPAMPATIALTQAETD